MTGLLRIEARNFRSLKSVDVTLGPLNVLVGPNEAGKSNFLDLIQFLGDSARYDLSTALDARGGYDRVRFRGTEGGSGRVSINVSANVTRYSSATAPDEYGVSFSQRRLQSGRAILVRSEEFTFKRTQGRGRRIKVSGDRAQFIDVTSDDTEHPVERLPLRTDALGLTVLRTLPDDEGGAEIERFARLFTTFRVFNPNVDEARRGSRSSERSIDSDASNLASALVALSSDRERLQDLVEDARAMIPGFQDLEFVEVGGSAPSYVVKIAERGLRDSTFLADASFGTVRLLALLALLYDPEPPQVTCIEEIDHGLHPYLFDRLVERLREASRSTQLLIATHSPALVNRLRPEELLVVERAPDGSTRMPAISRSVIRQKREAVGDRLELGELWFSGGLGGVPR